MPDHPHLGARKIVRFGNLEAGLRNEELRRAGIRIRVQAQPFRMLALLLERPGEIVTRAEVVRRLWGDETFVDLAGLATQATWSSAARPSRLPISAGVDLSGSERRNGPGGALGEFDSRRRGTHSEAKVSD